MDTVIILSVLCLCLCGWVMWLQRRVITLYRTLNGATDLIIDLAEGNATLDVNKTDRVITIKKKGGV